MHELPRFDSNEDSAYKTHKGTPSEGGIGVVTPSSHSPHPPTDENTVNVYVGWPDWMKRVMRLRRLLDKCVAENFLFENWGKVDPSENFLFEELGEKSMPEKISPAGSGENCERDRAIDHISHIHSEADVDVHQPCGEGMRIARPDHPEDDDPGECDPGFPPEDI